MPVSTTMLAPDAQVPHRDLLVDPAEVAERLAPMLGYQRPITIDRCERIRVKYRIGESLRVVHRVQVQGVWYLISARTFRNGASREAYRRGADVAVGSGPLCPVVHDAALDTVFWTFPNERKITNLAILTIGSRPLADLVGRPFSRVHVVAYAPERAATAQCLDADSRVVAYAKVYARDEGARSYAVHASLARSLAAVWDGVRIPQAIAYSEAHRTLVLEPITGRCLADLDGPQLQRASHRVGIALARLHTARPPDTRPSHHPGLDRIQKAASLIGQVRPDVADLARDLAADLVSQWEAPDDSPTCLHGDVNFRNWMINEEYVGIVDLDAVSIGPAAADLGRLLSGFRYRHHVGQLSGVLERQSVSAFLAGYVSVRALPAERAVRWHTAAALLTERVLHAITWFRAEALPYLDPLLSDARAILMGDVDV